jgi:hypothetical protein
MSEIEETEVQSEHAMTGRQIAYTRLMLKLVGVDPKDIFSTVGVPASTMWRWELRAERCSAPEASCKALRELAAKSGVKILDHADIPAPVSKE